MKGSVRISATLMFANFIVKKNAFIREIGIEIFLKCTFYKMYIFLFLFLGKKWKQIQKNVDISSIGEVREIETNLRLDCSVETSLSFSKRKSRLVFLNIIEFLSLT